MSALPPLRRPPWQPATRYEPAPEPELDGLAAARLDGEPQLTAEQRWAVDVMLKRNRARHGERVESEPESIDPRARAMLDAGKRRRGEA